MKHDILECPYCDETTYYKNKPIDKTSLVMCSRCKRVVFIYDILDAGTWIKDLVEEHIYGAKIEYVDPKNSDRCPICQALPRNIGWRNFCENCESDYIDVNLIINDPRIDANVIILADENTF